MRLDKHRPRPRIDHSSYSVVGSLSRTAGTDVTMSDGVMKVEIFDFVEILSLLVQAQQ